uniref:CX domain-containing protein n=1 Tax=Strongyloides venezuelensis TaxID=75913 RepID=A0A0K0FDP6_STRVS
MVPGVLGISTSNSTPQMNYSIFSYFILSFLFFNLNLAEKCTYTVPTNGYTTTYEIECPTNTNTDKSGTNVPTQTQVYYDPTYYNRAGNNMNYQTLGSNTNNVVYYYTDSSGTNYQYTNTNSQSCTCGTINCQCTTYYYYPKSGNSVGSSGYSGCSGNDCLTYIILNKRR